MITHSRPTIQSQDAEKAAEIIISGYLSEGKETRIFEKAISDYIGLGYACGISSGTAALFTILKAMDIGEGDEVVIPSFVCSSLFYAVKLAGAIPRVADSGNDPFHCDADTVSKVLSAKTKAIIFPHLFGSAKDISDIILLGVPVIEDIAMSIGAENKDIKAGNLGSVAAVCSFYATKVITTGEGGMILSDDSGLIEKVRDIIHYDGKSDGSFHFNFKMTNIAAALGNAQLGRLDDMIAERRMIAFKYTEAFAGTDMILPKEDFGEKSIFYRYVVQTPFVNELRDGLMNRGIAAERPLQIPIAHIKGITDKCPRADTVWKSTLSIPIYPSLTEHDTDFIVSSILKSLPH